MDDIHYLIFRRGSDWHVLQGARLDPDLTDAFRHAAASHSLSTQRKVAGFVESFLNFRCFDDEPADAFLRERFDMSRLRIDSFLEAKGFELVDGGREDDARSVRIGTAGSNSALPCCLSGLSRIYRRLSAMGLRPRANPLKVDNWHLLDPELKRELESSVYGRRLEFGAYRGSHYIVVQGASYALRMENPIGLGPRVLAAGKAFGWPDAIYDKVTVMDDEGCRWVDCYDLNGADWGLASGLGTTLLAPNKGSRGERVKRIVISQDTATQLRNSFDRDPRRPSFEELQRLLDARDFEALRSIPLFPSARGAPYSYHTFNNSYFRPAMEAGGVMIVSETSIARATAHRLRAGRAQESAEHIYREGRTDAQIAADRQALKEDLFLKSDKALHRYVGRLVEKRAEIMKIERMDERAARRRDGRTERQGRPGFQPGVAPSARKVQS
jgi:hypothetical protein